MAMRILTAAGVVVSAFVHLWLWIDGFRDIHVIGPAFMLNAVAGVVITVLLVARRSWIPLLLVVGFGGIDARSLLSSPRRSACSACMKSGAAAG